MRSPLIRALPLAFVAASICPIAHAQVTNFRVDTRIGQLSDGSTDIVANALAIDFDGQYTGSQLLVELTQGEIVNLQSFGVHNNYSPVPCAVCGLFDFDFELDTFLAQGGLRASDTIGGNPAFGGGAVNLDPTEVSAVWNDPVKISQAYNPAAGQSILDQTQFVVAQLSFTPDAQGTFAYFASANGEFFYTRDGNAMGGTDQYRIVNGRIVPEPAALAVLLPGVALMNRRNMG